MSAPLELNSEQLRDLARALDGLTELHDQTGVDVTPYGAITVGVGDARLTISWDNEANEYRVNDRNGD